MRILIPAADYEDACDKIREKTGTTDLIKSGELADKIEAVYENGKTAEWNEFWDNYQMNGNRRKYGYAFFGEQWNDITFKPKYDIIVEGSNSNISFSLFNYSQITDLAKICEEQGIRIDGSNCGTSTGQGWFTSCTYLTRTPPIPIGKDFRLSGFYLYCTRLHTVEGFYVHENQNMSGNNFGSCTSLQNLTIVGTIGQNGLDLHWSEKLTHESLMSVINALKDYSTDTSGTTHTVTIGTANLNKLSNEEKQIATKKGWSVL